MVEKLVKLTKELSTIIDLINHKYWDRMHDGVSGLVEKYFFQLQKISMSKDGKLLIQETFNKRLEWNLNCDSKDFL